MNTNRDRSILMRTVGVLVVVVSLLLATQAVLASGIIPQFGPLVLPSFEVKLLEAIFNPDGSSTWTYEIKITDPDGLDYAVSHSSIGFLDPACVVVSADAEGPLNVELNTKENNITLLPSDFKVVKWNELAAGISAVGDTRVFSLTITGAQVDQSKIDGAYVGVKFGQLFEEGLVEGPICATTAVSMASLSASSGSQAPVLMLTLALGITLAAAGALGKVRKSH